MKVLCEWSGSCRQRKGFSVLVWHAQMKMRKKKHFFEEYWYWSGGAVNSLNLYRLSGYLVSSVEWMTQREPIRKDRNNKGPGHVENQWSVFQRRKMIYAIFACGVSDADISYQRWCRLRAVTPKRRWRNQSLRFRRGGSPRRRAARWMRRWSWRWGAERRWWQLA